MITYTDMVRDAARYLERHRTCPKHHVEHTGSNCYLLDFYTELGEIEKGKRLVEYLCTLVRDTPGGHVFYPGHLDPMNMSQNIIDTGAAVDAIARYLRLHRGAFTAAEHARYISILRKVAETYLSHTALEKPITNQRLWGLTGLASFARYAGEEMRYMDVARESIERAFNDMTPDGFFLYVPHARERGIFEGYEGVSAFYQSRCSTFIRYALAELGMGDEPYRARLGEADKALLSMYRADGVKDMRLECKRWYWQSGYEVAASGFDVYALAHSGAPEASAALHNALYQVRRHFFDGYLHSHIGSNVNFQCSIFWTAHLAWMLRAPDVERAFDGADALVPFAFTLGGAEVFTQTSPRGRVLVNARWQQRNPTTGVFDNGMPESAHWSLRFPQLPPALGRAVRETVNHIWYALRGGHLVEASLREARFARECLVMLLPRYSARYGRVLSFERTGGSIRIRVIPATKYGTLSSREEMHTLPL